MKWLKKIFGQSQGQDESGQEPPSPSAITDMQAKADSVVSILNRLSELQATYAGMAAIGRGKDQSKHMVLESDTFSGRPSSIVTEF